MPTYLYKNLDTGEIYELKQSMRDEAYTHHPESGAAVKRIVSRPAIAFKGSGFYANDSRSGGKSASGPKSEAGAGGENGKNESKNESSNGTRTEGSAPASTPTPGTSTSSTSTSGTSAPSAPAPKAGE